MKKLLMTFILLGAAAAAIYGINIAYINTRALGYGEYNPPFAVATNAQGQTVYRIYDYIIDLNGIIS